MAGRKFDRILFVDIGRKYFGKQAIFRLIDTADGCGYSQLQLGFGNDGLRLLLKDMAMDGKDSDTVKLAVRAGNRAYNGDESCLSEEEMDEIIGYARVRGLELVPMLNVPAHMNAALAIHPDYRLVDGERISNNSLDVRSEAATAFGLELLRKYAAYFAGRGCRYFHFGADEYANDCYSVGGLGFSRLEELGKMDCFVSFLNKAAAVIQEAGMIPRAFNDGFYYHERTDMPVNPAIEVCYWGKGWMGFDCAAVQTIAQKGHPMINCNGEWYYVLKPEGSVQRPTEHERDGQKDFGQFCAELFPGGQRYKEPAGAMFCIWCDNSLLMTAEELAEDAVEQIRAMAKQVMLRE